MASGAVLLSDTFTGTTINTGIWAETDAGGVGGTTGNMRQNGSLTMTGSTAWGTNYLDTVTNYDRSGGGLEMEADVTCGASNSILGIGYGDPGVLTGGGQSYTMYIVSNTVYFSRQLTNSNAESVTTAFSCTPGVPFHVRIAVNSVTGASLYINGSGTAAASVTGGTFNNKGFFLSGHSGTASTIDNFVVNGTGEATEPDAPSSLVATPASTQMALSWVAPESNGASITDYLVEYKLSTEPTTWTTFADGTSTTASAIVTGLTNGTSYDFRVSAINSVGTGAVSSTVTATPALAVPTAPQSLLAGSSENTQSTLTWSAPLSDGGASITDYLVEYKLSTEPTTWTTFADSVSAITGAIVTGLTNSTSYNFRVSAINSVGAGTVSSTATATPAQVTLSDEFTGTTIDTEKWTEVDPGGIGGGTGDVTQNGSLSIASGVHTWGAQDGVRTVDTYDRTNGDVSMEFSVSRTTCGTGVAVAAGYGDFDFTAGGSASYIFISNLTNWEIYYWVGGVNQADSPEQLSGISSCTNGVPTTFKIVALQAGGAEVYVNGSGTASATIAGGTFTDKPFWIGSGISAGGTSTYDNVAIIEPATGPFAPTGVVGTAGDGQVALTWTSGGDNGAAITDYVVEYKLSTAGSWSTFSDGTSATTGATVTGLTNGSLYNFRVSATNANGTSDESSTVNARPVGATAVAPTASLVAITGAASLGELLTGSYTYNDANGNSEGSSTFRWLRSDSVGGTYSAISGATSINYTVTSNDLSKYLKFEVTPVSNTSPTTGSAALSAATAQVSEIDYINQILSTGQSLSVGVAASPALTTTQPYSNLMLTGGAGGLGAGGSFTPLIESSVETISSAMANTITANDSGNDFDVAVGLHGVSGYTYSQLKKGTSPYTNGMNQVTNTKSAAQSLGRTSRVIGVTTIHGETDNYNGVSGATYQTYLEEWQSNYDTDVKAITGQTGTIPLFLDQMSSFMSSYANDATSEIPIYQLKAAEDNPGDIVLVGPKYQFNYSDRHHLTAASSRWAGEYYGKVIKKVAVDHEEWRPLSPDSAERTGNIIYADFHVPAGELAFDTTLVSERDNYGFEYYDASSSATISSVELHDEDTVKITLSGTPTGSNQRLRYAYTGVAGTNTGAQNDGSAAGNLRDTDDFPSLYGNTLYNWAVHFDEPITVNAGGPGISSVDEDTVSASAVTITWTTDESATSQIEYGLTSTYTASTTESVSRASSHSRSITNLAACTTYHYRVRAEDLGGTETYSSDATFTTTCTGSATVTAQSASTVTVLSGGTMTLANLGLTIPTSFTATSSSVVFQAKRLSDEMFYSSVGKPAGRESVGTLVVNLTALTGAGTLLSTFDEPLEITFSYDDADIVGVDESSLSIYRYDGTSWHELSGCVVDTVGSTVTCETTSFSDFGLFGDASSEVAVADTRNSSRSSRTQYGCKDSSALNYERFVSHKAALCKYATEEAAPTVFSRNLDIGSEGADVTALQTLLIEQGHLAAGNAVGYFGPLTRAAVERFQQAHGISPVSGYVGPLTRMQLSGSTASALPVAAVEPTTSFGRDLDLGMTGEDVQALQQYLNNHGFKIADSGPGSPGNETTMFGYATKAALQRLQEARGVLPASGYFGPRTRAVIE